MLSWSIFLYGCSKQGNVGQSSLLNLIPEPPGANCAAGGIKVVSGIDANRNNVLEDNEIQNVKYVCNGSNGSSDKQVILYFPANGIAYETSSAAGQIDSLEVINNFDISNLPMQIRSHSAHICKQRIQMSVTLLISMISQIIR